MAKVAKAKIMVAKDGPYLVYGSMPIDKQIIGIGKEGEPDKWIQGKRYPQAKPVHCAAAENQKVNPSATEPTPRSDLKALKPLAERPMINKQRSWTAPH